MLLGLDLVFVNLIKHDHPEILLVIFFNLTISVCYHTPITFLISLPNIQAGDSSIGGEPNQTIRAFEYVESG